MAGVDETATTPGDPGAHRPVATFDRPELTRLWEAARARLERTGRSLKTGPVRLRGLDNGEITAICGLLGQRRPAGDSINVRLDALDARLRAGAAGTGLLEVLEIISGPIRDRPAELAGERQATVRLWRVVSEHPVAGDENVGRWLESLRSRGRVTRLGVADPAALMADVLDGVEGLLTRQGSPSAVPLPLPALAATQVGDGHALDPGTPMGTLLTDAVRFLSGTDDERDAWHFFGIQMDRLSSSALTYMLPGEIGSLIEAAAVATEPLRITFRMLDRGFGLDTRGIGRVHLCENQAILSLAADTLGSRCRPLICLEGMPGSVTGDLLGQLRDVGADLVVHTDFDHGGIAIASHVISCYGARPWRMRAHDYRDALGGPTVDLPRAIGATPWDTDLSAEMNRNRRAVHEEAIFRTLLADLDTRGTGGPGNSRDALT